MELGEDVITLDMVLRRLHADYRSARHDIAAAFGPDAARRFARRVWEHRGMDLNPWTREAAFLAYADSDREPVRETAASMLEVRQRRQLLRTRRPTLLGHLLHMALTVPGENGARRSRRVSRPEKLAQARTPTAETGLMIATRRRNRPLIDRLRQRGASLTARNMLGWDVVMYAGRTGQLDLLDLYLTEGGTPDSSCLLGRAVLSHTIVCKQRPAALRVLADPRTRLDQQDVFGHAPVTLALLSDQPDILEDILRRGPDLTIRDAHGRTLDDVLAHARVRLSDPTRRLFEQARTSWQIHTEAGTDPRGRNLLGSDIPREVLTRFILSRQPGDAHRNAAERMLAEQLGHRAPAPDSPEGRMFTAFANNDLNRVRAIIGHEQPDLNTRDAQGLTLMFRATVKREAALLMFLSNRGASPDVPTLTGETPLMQSAGDGELALSRQILDMNADPLCRDAAGRSARDRAATARKHGLARELDQAERRCLPPHPPAPG